MNSGIYLLMATIISHLGLLEAPKDPITSAKVIGALLLFAGVVVPVNRSAGLDLQDCT